jgi:YfiH family protein
VTPLLNIELPRGRFKVFSEKPSFEFLSVHQVHGTEILSADSHDLSLQSADGITVTRAYAGPALAIKTADCLPIIVLGKNGYAALHAGWKGLAAGILSSEKLKAIEPDFFFIGPFIHACCYEVSSDFEKYFPASKALASKNGKVCFDLGLEAETRINLIFPGAHVKVSPVCTSCDKHFHSYRRNRTDKRNWNIYLPTGSK